MSFSDYSTKYALTIAGGENFDLIYTSTWAYYQSEANKGAFAEVTEQVLNDYMPLHKENQAEASWGQAKIGGKVYFVPCNMANVSANAILIRGDLREKYDWRQKRIWKNIIRRCQMTRILRLLMPMMLHRTMILPRQSCFRPKMIGEGWKAPWSIMCPINIPMIFRRMIYSGCTGQRSIWNMRSS